MKRVLFSALIGTLVACAASAQPITCPPPPSTFDVQKNFAVGAEVSLLSRFLNSFGLNYKQQNAITQNLSQLPNADELYETLYFMSYKCQSIMAQRVPEEEKLRQWNDFIDDRLSKSTPPIPPSEQERRNNISRPDRDERQLPPKRPGSWADVLIGSWTCDIVDVDNNNIPATMVYTFNPDGSFLSIEGRYGEFRGRFQYQRTYMLIEWNNGVYEYAELDIIGVKDQFRYKIVDHTHKRMIGKEFIFQRLHR